MHKVKFIWDEINATLYFMVQAGSTTRNYYSAKMAVCTQVYISSVCVN